MQYTPMIRDTVSKGGAAMYQYTVGIVDDEPVIRRQIQDFFTAYESERGNHMVLSEFATGEALLNAYQESAHPFQILIIDVELPGISGTKAAMEIRQKDKDVCILFLTAFEAYALDAYQADAIGYLVKPVGYTKLKALISKAIIQIDYVTELYQAARRYLTVTSKYQKVHIEISKIVYVEKRHNLCILHCQDAEYACYETLSQLFTKLQEHGFYYSHQGYIVNFKRVQSVGRSELFMDSHAMVPLSRRYYKEMYQRMVERIKRSRELMLQAEKNEGF